MITWRITYNRADNIYQMQRNGQVILEAKPQVNVENPERKSGFHSRSYEAAERRWWNGLNNLMGIITAEGFFFSVVV